MNNLPNILKEDNYSNVQAFMRTFQEIEDIVEQYNCVLVQWAHQVNTKAITANQKRHRPPKKTKCVKISPRNTREKQAKTISV